MQSSRGHDGDAHGDVDLFARQERTHFPKGQGDHNEASKCDEGAGRGEARMRGPAEGAIGIQGDGGDEQCAKEQSEDEALEKHGGLD